MLAWRMGKKCRADRIAYANGKFCDTLGKQLDRFGIFIAYRQVKHDTLSYELQTQLCIVTMCLLHLIRKE